MIDPLTWAANRRTTCFQALLSEPLKSAYAAVRETWQTSIKGDFETGWRQVLHSGWIDGTAFDTKGSVDTAIKGQVPTPAPKDAIEIIFRPDPDSVRRPLLERGLAAGASEAGYEPELGQPRRLFRARR